MLDNGSSSVVIEESGWKFVVSRSSFREEGSRGIGILRSPVKFLTPERNLIQALKGKLPSKYELDAPYLIAVTSHDYFLDELSIVDCLFGASVFQQQLHLNKRSDPSFFIQNAEFANSSVSCILLLKKWDIYILTSRTSLCGTTKSLSTKLIQSFSLLINGIGSWSVTEFIPDSISDAIIN